MNKKTKSVEWFSMGLLLKEFSIFTNKDSVQETANETADQESLSNLSNKTVKLVGFSIFCDWQNFQSIISRQQALSGDKKVEQKLF